MDSLITYFRLGLFNLFRVAAYKLALKLGIHPVQKVKYNSIEGEFFKYTENIIFSVHKDLFSVNKLKKGYNPFSSSYFLFENESPNWHRNYYNNRESKFKNFDWWKIPDFDPMLGDIKTVWELSRFEWVIQLALIASSGNRDAIKLLNSRLNNWIQENQPYKGVNWKCGQESSIRVMHLIFAAIILKQLDSPSKLLIDLIEMHIKRISPTISYAIAQNNNHGTSEAAALFLGGHFLFSHGNVKYKKIKNLGRKCLENRANKLFTNDGCFSQYSVNYHRLALDTFCFCETYRILNGLNSFSNNLYYKVKKATNWLELLTDPKTGDAPNIGENDGAKIFNIFNTSYRDYRQSVQWANLVFNSRSIYPILENHKIIYSLLGIKTGKTSNSLPLKQSVIKGNDDGFFIYQKNDVLLIFKRPIFKFRPSHSDALHVDLWIKGKNILRDGGSYSYNSNNKITSYYTGISSHNSIQFDKRDQMPKISRFLFGSWLKEIGYTFKRTEKYIFVSSGYSDYLGASHIRKLLISDNSIIIKDVFWGGKKNAKINWRLNPNQFNFESCIDNKFEINIDIQSGIVSGDFNKSIEFESRYYLNESQLPVVYKTLAKSGTFRTNIFWQ